MVAKLTSYSGVSGSTAVNEVEMEYNDFRQLVTEYQSHSGAVNKAVTPKVQYAFTNGSANHVRLDHVIYPDSRQIDYSYGTAGELDDHLSRLAAIQEDSSSLAEFTYLGRGTVVRQEYPEPGVRYDLWGGTAGAYTGFDRFLRVVDLKWQTTGGSPSDLVRIRHGYDRNSNRLYRENVVATAAGKALDQLYSYDRLNRLADMKRGTLNAEHDEMTLTNFEQTWGLDRAGNWSEFDQDDNGDGTWNLEQTRETNKGNEIVDVGAGAGQTVWATPSYDAAGNMLKFPKPEVLTESFAGVYDAWHRLVKVKEGSQLLMEYAYDGRSFRIVKETYSEGSQVEERHHYFTSSWQLIEERVATPTPDDVEAQYVWGLGINELILRDRDITGDGTLNERLYALQDSHWDMCAVTDTSGTVKERYEYQAYGKAEVLDASFNARSSSSCDWNVLYSGYQLDGEAGLYCVRYRYYHSELGCWITRDPLFDHWMGWMVGETVGAVMHIQAASGTPAGVALDEEIGTDASLYALASGRVMSEVDPLGLVAISDSVRGIVQPGCPHSGGKSAALDCDCGILTLSAWIDAAKKRDRHVFYPPPKPVISDDIGIVVMFGWVEKDIEPLPLDCCCDFFSWRQWVKSGTTWKPDPQEQWPNQGPPRSISILDYPAIHSRTRLSIKREFHSEVVCHRYIHGLFTEEVLAEVDWFYQASRPTLWADWTVSYWIVGSCGGQSGPP
jgi:RHS repeat-associated protein